MEGVVDIWLTNCLHKNSDTRCTVRLSFDVDVQPWILISKMNSCGLILHVFASIIFSQFIMQHSNMEHLLKHLDTWIIFCVCLLYFLFRLCCQSKGFDDVDSIYASPADFQSMKQRDKIRGTHLLEYFVNQCHQLGVVHNLMLFFSIVGAS